MSSKPRIAIIMDENTQVDGTRYEVSKAYFLAIHRAGGLPFGIPYFAGPRGHRHRRVRRFRQRRRPHQFSDRLVCGRGPSRNFPLSDRLDVDRALMSGFLDRDKPVLGICNGMQMLACLNGCRMVSDVRALRPDILQHDERGVLHPATIKAGTALSRIVGVSEIDVNTHHREASCTSPTKWWRAPSRPTARSRPSKCRRIASRSACNGTRRPSPATRQSRKPDFQGLRGGSRATGVIASRRLGAASSRQGRRPSSVSPFWLASRGVACQTAAHRRRIRP